MADPGGGSWYIESLTDSLGRQAWELFQLIEGNGGMFQALKSGFVQEQIKDVADKRFMNIGSRRDKFVGTNMYPNLSEQKLSKHEGDSYTVYQSRCLEVSSYRRSRDTSEKQTLLNELRANGEQIVYTSIKAIHAGATLSEWVQAVSKSDEAPSTIQALDIHRGTERFEALRKKAEMFKEKNGSYPKVFLANMGPIPQHKPRADFAKGFFEVGGFEVISNSGFETVDQAVQVALESNTSIVVICSN